MKNIFETTMTEYKAVLKQWNKGTGGGPGLDIYFESWDGDKLDKYKLNLEDYDHSSVKDRPAILIDAYHQDHTKKPYITIIHLWNALSHNLLSSKHDPFEGNCGKIGFGSSDDSSLTSRSKSSPSSSSKSSRMSTARRLKRKGRKGKNVIVDADTTDDIQTVVQDCMTVLKQNNPQPSVAKKKKSQNLDDLTLNELYELMEQHKKYLTFLKDNDMCTETEKKDVVQRVKDIYCIINNRNIDSDNSNINKSVS